MRFSPAFLDELRARLPVSEVVGRRVRLKKAGREFKGLSPFNQEKTPSFTVNDQKGFFHDFSSGKHGDIFRFVMESEGVTFPEAVERLAAMAGLPLPAPDKQAEAREARRRTLHEVMELAAKFFAAQLAARPGANARAYLERRGVSAAAIRYFRIGYAPAERFALKEHLGAQGVPTDDMIETGLLVAADDVPVPYDRFRDRVMFPILDWRARVIAFGGRALSAEVTAKYLNSPETALFHKGGNLYNGAAARTAAHSGAEIVVVEGYLDVIALVEAGFAGAVAPLGTALTEDQLGLLWRMADEPVLCLDGDKAGRRAAHRIIDVALPYLKPGKSLRFATLPAGQDPDDLVRAGGREAMTEVLSGARGLIDALWERETATANLQTPERRAALEAKLHAAVAEIRDEAVRRHYRHELDARLRQLWAPARSYAAPGRGSGARGARAVRPGSLGRGPGRPGGPAPWPTAGAGAEALAQTTSAIVESAMIRGFRSAMPRRESLILYAILNHPWLLEAHCEELAELEFAHPDADRLRRTILDLYDGHTTFDPASLRAQVAGRGAGAVAERIDRSLAGGPEWPARPDAAAADVNAWWAHVITLHRKARTLHKELREAEHALGSEPSEEHLAWLKDVRERLWALEGTEAEIEGFGAASGRPAKAL